MKLGLKDIIFMNLVGIFSLRQIPYVAQYGASSIILWLFAAFGFFIPLALVCGELGAKFQKSGGIFLWINKAFGVKIAYFCLVCYLLSCLAFFPMMLYFAASSLAFVLEIKARAYFVAGFSVFSFCLLTYINYRGISYTKFINIIFVYLGIVLPFVILLVVCVLFINFNGELKTPYNTGFLPEFDINTLVFASSMMFAFAGLELSMMMSTKIENAQQTYPKAVIISAFLIVSIYILGTFFINAIYPAKDTDILDGIMQAITYSSEILGIQSLPKIMAFCLLVGTLGQINSWLIAPIYMLASASKEGIIKFYEAKPHPKYGTPYRALFVQAVLVSVVCIFCVFFTKAKDIYWILSSLTTVSYFLPYVAMFLAYFKLKNYNNQEIEFGIKNKYLSLSLATLGLASVLFSLGLSFTIPSDNEGSAFNYFLEILISPILAFFIVIFTFDKNCK